MSDLMREEMKKAYEDVVGEPWDDEGLHKQAWCISWEKAWQASRERLVIELPDKWGEYTEAGYAACDMRERIAEVIHAAGVKTK